MTKSQVVDNGAPLRCKPLGYPDIRHNIISNIIISELHHVRLLLNQFKGDEMLIVEIKVSASPPPPSYTYLLYLLQLLYVQL